MCSCTCSVFKWLFAGQCDSELFLSLCVNYHMTAADASTPFVVPLLARSIIDTGLHLGGVLTPSHSATNTRKCLSQLAFLLYLEIEGLFG